MLDHVTNARDIGGLEGELGTLRRGVVLRSGAPGRVSAADRERLDALGVGLVCDLRLPSEVRGHADLGRPVRRIPLGNADDPGGWRRRVPGYLLSPDGVERFRAFLARTYEHVVFAQAASVGEVLRAVAHTERGVWIHCRAGRDRTGLVVALLQLAVGASPSAVRAHYVASNEAFLPRAHALGRLVGGLSLGGFEARRLVALAECHGEDLDRILARITARFGSLDAYLADACGLDDATRDALRTRLIESGAPRGQTG